MEKEFSEIEALKVIRQSIEQTKETFREKGLVYLILGWVVFIAAIVNFFLIRYNIRNSTDLIWGVLLLAAFSPGLYGWITNYSGHSVGSLLNPDMTRPPIYFLWRGFSFTLLVVLIFDARAGGGLVTIPITTIISLLGLAAYVSGAMLKFRPLLIGGGISVITLPVASINIIIAPHPEYKLLVLAAAILCSYIIPGHLLRAGK